jgi:hypothetical protein
MKLKKYYRSLSLEQRKEYANRVGYKHDYVRVHLIPATKNPDSTPPLSKLKSMADESGGAVSFEDVVKHFELVDKRIAA